MKLIGCIFLTYFLEIALGCHSAEDSEELSRRRKKRQADNEQMLVRELERTTSLREFFVNCLRERAGDFWTWESVIDVTILDTQWYENSAGENNCLSGTSSDSAECWKNRLSQLLQSTSRLQGPSRECIDMYTINVTGSLQPTVRRGKRQAPATSESEEERCTDFFPNSPAVRMFTQCNSENVQLPTGRRDVDFPSVSQFVAEDLICSSELMDCSADETETISGDDANVPNWPYLFEAVTRGNSPVRDSVVTCNNRIFPLATDDTQGCSDWGTWSSCICGSRGTRSRNRRCPPGFTGDLRERERCTDDNCVTSFIELLRRIFFVRTFRNLPPNFAVRYPTG